MIRLKYMNSQKIIIIFLLFFGGRSAKAQDTAALIKEFNKVMSFAVQPYVYFKTDTRMEADPVVQKEDTINMTGVFYKNGTEVYSRNGGDEMFLEDSLWIQIDHENKKIMISRVNLETKGNINLLPLDKKKMQDMLREGFTITKTIESNGIAGFTFENRQLQDSVLDVRTRINVQYSTKEYFPTLLSMDASFKKRTDPETLEQLKNEGINLRGIAVNEQGIDYLVRHQKFTIRFERPEFSKELSSRIPLWQERLNFNSLTGEFSGKGEFRDFEITKTF